ncbi:MAG TPA: lysophospholipid acyltransferase family protein [Longimicrobiales bacterium]|nr:lysophospholipid acyltransferase family protein [Longimicrobiales bacterium]
MADGRRMAMAAFETVFRPWFRHRVDGVLVRGEGLGVPGQPVLVAANHVSWWDGFVVREAQRRLRPGASLVPIMLRRELDRQPVLRGLGVVGLEPGSTGSLRHALRELDRRLAAEPDSVILLFPQGRIWPSHRRPLGFRRGLELFARVLDVPVIPMAIHMEPLDAVSPTFFVAAAPALHSPAATRVERSVERELDAILEFVAIYGEDAARVWPGPDPDLPVPPELGAGRAPELRRGRVASSGRAP